MILTCRRNYPDKAYDLTPPVRLNRLLSCATFVRKRTNSGAAIVWAVSFSDCGGPWYDRGMEVVSAFVLAGGQSTRMGTEKALIELGGQTLLARALALVTGVTPRVRILGSKARFGAFGEVVEDEFPDHGPLGGIHAALRASRSELNLILAMDMPFVERRLLQYLVREAQKHDAAVTVPRPGGNWQPLCAIYRRSFADLAQDALQRGRNKIDALFRETTVHVLEEEDLRKQKFSGDMFWNLNSPEDVRQAEVRLQSAFSISRE
jgi:molybdenum cofactor guanylyltransferase